MSDDNVESKFEAVLSGIRRLTGYGLKLAVVIILAVIAWRLAWAGLSIDLSKFEFSDLLAMVLALFAIAISVAFYFKTTDSSAQFYDNIYNFTKNTSEILGRIEERFGERLKHIDEGYGRIQSHFEGVPQSSDEIKKEVEEKKGKEQEVKGNLKAVLQERNELIQELSQRAYREQTEREQFMNKMTDLESKRESAESKIRAIEEERDRLQQQLELLDMDMMEGFDGEESRLVEELLSHLPEMRHLIAHNPPGSILQRHFRQMLAELPAHMGVRLHKAGITNNRSELTPAGLLTLRSMVRRLG